jgi:dienelactone hydrolase
MDCHEPNSSAGVARSGGFPAIVLLHGAGGNLERWLDYLAPALNRMGTALYGVHYFERTGTKRADAAAIADGVHVQLWLETVRDALEFVSRRPGIDASRVALVGISLGAFLALAAASGSTGVRAVVDISGGLVEPWASQATAAFPPALIVHGDADTVVPVTHARELDALLTRLEVRHQTLILPGEGHWFSPGGHLRILAAVSGFLGKFL